MRKEKKSICNSEGDSEEIKTRSSKLFCTVVWKSDTRRSLTSGRARVDLKLSRTPLAVGYDVRRGVLRTLRRLQRVFSGRVRLKKDGCSLQ